MQLPEQPARQGASTEAPATKSQAINLWLACNTPTFWGRGRAALLMATTFCAYRWLCAENPDFTKRQAAARNLLAVVIFLRPTPLPLKIVFKPGRA